jgi:predicted ATPase/DNA-binding SARP family transcriptional activator
LPGLRIAVLGKPRITRDDRSPVDPGSAKATALLLYLAVTGERHSRSALAGLLWGDLPEEGARANLRLALTKLRRVAADQLQVSRGYVAADPSSYWLDRREFEAALGGGDGDLERVRAAVRLYRGDFLDDLVVRSAPEFEAWVEGEREHLRRLAVSGLARLADDAAGRGDPAAGVEAARRMLSLDPLSEEAQRALMRFLAMKDDRAAAMAQFETCRHVLAEELGVDPSPETVRLADQIRAGDLAPRRPEPRHDQARAPGPSAPPGPPAAPAPVGPPPDQPAPWEPPVAHGPLIGREDDLARVVELVEGEACRLLTLVGPGGVGKTRLAMAAAERLAGGFAGGAAFVALAGVEPDDPDGVADLVAVTVAETLAVPLAARRPVRELLQAYLAERRLLVVLDNLEQLPGIAPLLTDLLAGAPGLKLLATSRRRVGAGVEWVLDVPGLAYPPPGAPDDGLDRYPAVELFGERAGRVRAGFSLAAEGPAVAAICRLVEGLPLAIELAADLARALPCQVIADKLGSDLDLLETASATVQRRHRSMRSVIEASWRLLDDVEQQALARLSVFRGGFDPAAAEAVAGATLPMLSSLVERSLVDRGDGGRYGLHELLRQFAEERLEAAGDAGATRRAHADHYAGFLRDRRDRLADALNTAVMAEVDPETDNLRAAWQELVEEAEIDAVAGLLEDLWVVLRRRSRFQEALGLLHRARARADATVRQRTRWHLWAGQALYQLGRAEEGLEELRAMLGLAGRPLPARAAGWAAAVARGAARQARTHTLGARPAPDQAARQAAADMSQAYAIVGETYYMAGQLLPMVATGIDTINFAERAGSPSDIASGYAVTAVGARVAGRHRLADWYGRLADRAMADGGDAAALAYALEVRAVDDITVAAWAAAEARLGRAAGAFARMGELRFWDECTALLAVADCYRGRYGRAVDGFAKVAASARGRHDPLSLLWGLAGEAEARLRRTRDTGQARELLEEATTLFGDLPAAERLRVHAGLGQVHLRAGRDDEAAAAVGAALADAAQAGMLRMWLGEALASVAEVALELEEHGHPPSAGAGACEVLRGFAERCPVAAAKALRADGLRLWLAGRRPRAVRAWRRSLDTARRLDLPYDEAMAHLELGRHLRAPETTPGGWGRDEHLARSRELFEALGTEPALRRAATAG